jgi:hypothetical protein
MQSSRATSVARWYIFKPKKSNLGKFWKVFHRKMLVFLWPSCLFYSQMVHFMAIWYILWPFGTFCGHFVYISTILVSCTEKNLATLRATVKKAAASEKKAAEYCLKSRRSNPRKAKS